jgi:hypothetical protein
MPALRHGFHTAQRQGRIEAIEKIQSFKPSQPVGDA